MVQRLLRRFDLCDLGFFPYLIEIINRLPNQAKNIILNDLSFQILSDDNIFETQLLLYDFTNPITSLLYLNTRLLDLPDDQIIYSIATEIVRYLRKKEELGIIGQQIDDLLTEWGFEKEIARVSKEKVL